MGVRRETEAGFQRLVTEYAALTGWLLYHTHDARRSPEGFPDLVLVRERVVFVELKTDAGRTTAAQDRWLERLRAAGAEVFLWRPSDWDDIQRVLGRAPASAGPPAGTTN